MTPTQRAAMEQALEILECIDSDYWHDFVKGPITDLRAALAEQPAEQDGLPLVVAGAIFDFAGYMTTRSKVIEVGSTAEAGPVAGLVKDWAELRGLSLDDAAVLSWQEWLPTAPQPAKPSDDTMYLLRRLLSNQHTLTGPEFRQELARIVEDACSDAPQPAQVNPAFQAIADAEVAEAELRWLKKLREQHRPVSPELEAQINVALGLETPTAQQVREFARSGGSAIVTGHQEYTFTDERLHKFVLAAIKKFATQPVKRVPLTPRELELIDGMIEVQLTHAERCDVIANRRIAAKQKEWDMERVELLRKIREHGITGEPQ